MSFLDLKFAYQQKEQGTRPFASARQGVKDKSNSCFAVVCCGPFSYRTASLLNLKAEIWVKALIRRAAVANVPGMVARRGQAEAGTVYIKVARLDGTADVYGPTWGENGERVWMRVSGEGPISDGEAEAYLERQAKFDPDFWVVELEDKEGRHFLTEPVL